MTYHKMIIGSMLSLVTFTGNAKTDTTSVTIAYGKQPLWESSAALSTVKGDYIAFCWKQSQRFIARIDHYAAKWRARL